MKSPLVSIGIISFNNDSYISECIESCLRQTYSNIEIIIADDASTDSSVEIINDYAKKYPLKIRTVLSKENTGISANFNKAVRESNGEWFKIIACDDVLLPKCIEDYMNAVRNLNIKSGILFSHLQSFTNNHHINTINKTPNYFNLGYAQRVQSILVKNTLPTPTAFFNLVTLQELGLADENYPFLEDYPLWVKATINNVNMYYIENITVKYRIHDSVSQSVEKIGNIKFYESLLDFSRAEVWNKRSGIDRLKNIDDYIALKKMIFSIRVFSNKRSFTYSLFSLIIKPIKPYLIISQALKLSGMNVLFKKINLPKK